MFKDVISRGWLRLHIVLFLVSILLNYIYFESFRRSIPLIDDYLYLYPEDIVISASEFSITVLPIRPYIPFPILYIFILLIIVWIKKGFRKS